MFRLEHMGSNKLSVFLPPQSNYCISTATFFICTKFKFSLGFTQIGLVIKHSFLPTLRVGHQAYPAIKSLHSLYVVGITWGEVEVCLV